VKASNFAPGGNIAFFVLQKGLASWRHQKVSDRKVKRMELWKFEKKSREFAISVLSTSVTEFTQRS
jgi:hypothetical protein